MAMPRAVPACWIVSLRAEPTPALSSGIVPMSAPTAAGIARPAPRPRRPRATAGMTKPVSAVTVVRSAKEDAITSMPARIRYRWPYFAVNLAPAALPISAVTASGTKARPAFTGE